jgi:CheY-like chemotaxis protein
MSILKRAASKGMAGGAADGKRRVFLVDDHAIVRRGLMQLINNEGDLLVCGQGEDAYGSLRAIRESKPDLCIIDVSLKNSAAGRRLGVADLEARAKAPGSSCGSAPNVTGARLRPLIGLTLCSDEAPCGGGVSSR